MISHIDQMRTITDAATDTEWRVYFTMHGDAHVIGSELSRLRPGGKPAFPQDLLATISSARKEYGRSDAKFIATFDPPVVAAMLDALEAAERARNRLHYTGANRRGTYLNATYQDLDAALERVREQWEANRD